MPMSAGAAAAYRAGEHLTNDRDGVTHDYTGRRGVDHAEIVLPPGQANRPPKDFLRAKVRAARETAEMGQEPVPPAETAREALKRELRKLDGLSLSWAAKAASVRDRDGCGA